MNKEPKAKIACSEDQLQVAETCKKMLAETGCDFIVCLFPRKDGGEELIKATVNNENMAAHFNSVAEEVAKRLGVSREQALISLAMSRSFTADTIALGKEENNDR